MVIARVKRIQLVALPNVAVLVISSSVPMDPICRLTDTPDLAEIRKTGELGEKTNEVQLEANIRQCMTKSSFL